jgi:type VI protein secretion system component VasK
MSMGKSLKGLTSAPYCRLGQWLQYTEGHERWWDAIWAAMHRAGVKEVTCTPEHGPPNYQV